METTSEILSRRKHIRKYVKALKEKKHIIVLSEHKIEPEILMNNERGWSDPSATTESL